MLKPTKKHLSWFRKARRKIKKTLGEAEAQRLEIAYRAYLAEDGKVDYVRRYLRHLEERFGIKDEFEGA